MESHVRGEETFHGITYDIKSLPIFSDEKENEDMNYETNITD